MKKKAKKILEELALEAGLQFSEENGALWGEVQGYPVVVYVPNDGYPKILQAVFGAALHGRMIEKEDKKEIRKSEKGITRVETTATSVSITFKASHAQAGASILRAVANDLQKKGFTRGCQHCGKDVPTVGANIAGAYLSLCDECFETLRGQMEVAQSQYQSRKESIVSGSVGALLGSLIGAAAIVLVSQLGYVAAVTGLIMAVCTLIGYEKLGGKLTKKGVVICAVIMLVMTYAANQIDWAILIMREFDAGFFESYQAIPLLLKEGVILENVYWGNLALVYLFLLIGAVPMMLRMLRNPSAQGQISRMDQANYTAG